MAANTPEGFKGDLSGKVARIIGALFESLTEDEAGNATLATGEPYTVPVTNDLPDETAPWPSVAIRLDLGPEPAGMSNQLVDVRDDGTGVFGFWAPDATITCLVTARRDAERTYLADLIEAGVQQSAWVDPTTNLRYEGAIKMWLGALGIRYKGMGRVAYPEPNPNDARPEGIPFRAEVPIQCEIFVTWLGVPNAGVSITTTQTPSLGTAVTSSVSL